MATHNGCQVATYTGYMHTLHGKNVNYGRLLGEFDIDGNLF